jgi:hypothetical protein
MKNYNNFPPFHRENPKSFGIPFKLSAAGKARRAREANARANQLPPEEQTSRFLQWPKVKDAGHQPC